MRKRWLRGWVAAATAAALALSAAACNGPQSQVATISAETLVSDGAERSIGPSQIPDPVLYRLSGIGPENANFSQTAVSLPTNVDGLLPGDWVITVEAIDADDNIVLHGSSETMVASGHPTAISVILTPTGDTGHVNIELLWPGNLVSDPHVVAVVENEASGAVPLGVQLSAEPGRATCTADSLQAGWYHLRLQLQEGTAVVAGRAELLEVRGAETTSASITISELNKPGTPILIQGTQFDLLWDPGEGGSPMDPVVRYNVYYRNHGTFPWVFLGDTGTLVESYQISTDILPHGSYDFAVSSVTASGAESVPHTSLEDTAEPQTGWYVVWEP